MSFNLLDKNSKQLVKDKSKITLLTNLLKVVVLLKPDKGNGIVLVDCLDYKNSVKQMFLIKQNSVKLMEIQHLEGLELFSNSSCRFFGL